MKNQLIVIVITLLTTEITLRLIGFPPLKHNDYTLESSPSFFLNPSKKYGFELNPGRFSISINSGPKWESIQTNSTERSAGISTDSLLNIEFYGCSFTFGFGVNNIETYPSLINDLLTEYNSKNYSVPGFGTVQSYLLLKQKTDWHKTKAVVLAYSNLLHQSRNVMTKTQQHQWSEAYTTKTKSSKELISGSSFPYVSSTNPIEIKYISASDLYKPGKIYYCSSIAVLIYKARHTNSVRNSNYTFELIKEIKQLCDLNNTPLYIVGITNDERTQNDLIKFELLDIPTKNISVDLSDPLYNQMPYDGHPSSEAHTFYANKINDFLVDELF